MPVTGYQLREVVKELSDTNKELAEIKRVLESIDKQTRGVVTTDIMETFVDKRINEKLKPLVEHKNNTTKLGWSLLLLIIGDIATRVFNVIR